MQVNDKTENIGARRLHTVMERLLDEVSFDAPDLKNKSIVIDEIYVERMLANVVKNEDLSRLHPVGTKQSCWVTAQGV